VPDLGVRGAGRHQHAGAGIEHPLGIRNAALWKLGHDPRRYIRDTLKRILDGEKDLNALLPENYKPDVGLDAEPPAQSAAA
jgi:hypothetical protein